MVTHWKPNIENWQFLLFFLKFDNWNPPNLFQIQNFDFNFSFWWNLASKKNADATMLEAS
jgi:hypothetical protein